MTINHITTPTIIMRGHAEQRTLETARAKQLAARKRIQATLDGRSK